MQIVILTAKSKPCKVSLHQLIDALPRSTIWRNLSVSIDRVQVLKSYACDLLVFRLQRPFGLSASTILKRLMRADKFSSVSQILEYRLVVHEIFGGGRKSWTSFFFSRSWTLASRCGAWNGQNWGQRLRVNLRQHPLFDT